MKMRDFVLVTILCGIFSIMVFSSCQNRKSSGEIPIFFNTSAMDSTVRPQDDFFQFANGKWIEETKIPASEAAWGEVYELRDNNLKNIKSILDSVSNDQHVSPGSAGQKVGDLFASAMDTVTIEKLGGLPIKKDLDRIADISNAQGILNEVVLEYHLGVPALFSFYAAPDDKNSSWEVAHFDQGGLGLPNRDYYFKQDSSIQKIRLAYQQYIANIFSLLGDPQQVANQKSAGVMKLETALAEASKNPVELRDPNENYHKKLVTQLDDEMPTIKWSMLLGNMKIDQDTILVGQPKFYENLGKLLAGRSIEDWKNYLIFHWVDAFAPYLSNDFVQTQFEFNRFLTGRQVLKPRWKRMASLVDDQLGDALGQLYVEKFFPLNQKSGWKNW